MLNYVNDAFMSIPCNKNSLAAFLNDKVLFMGKFVLKKFLAPSEQIAVTRRDMLCSFDAGEKLQLFINDKFIAREYEPFIIS